MGLKHTSSDDLRPSHGSLPARRRRRKDSNDQSMPQRSKTSEWGANSATRGRSAKGPERCTTGGRKLQQWACGGFVVRWRCRLPRLKQAPRQRAKVRVQRYLWGGLLAETKPFRERPPDGAKKPKAEKPNPTGGGHGRPPGLGFSTNE